MLSMATLGFPAYTHLLHGLCDVWNSGEYVYRYRSGVEVWWWWWCVCVCLCVCGVYFVFGYLCLCIHIGSMIGYLCWCIHISSRINLTVDWYVGFCRSIKTTTHAQCDQNVNKGVHGMAWEWWVWLRWFGANGFTIFHFYGSKLSSKVFLYTILKAGAAGLQFFEGFWYVVKLGKTLYWCL